jgi:colicin import membrane protein
MLMHLLLLGFLWIGVSWQNTVPVSIEAEIWSPQLRMAAPPAPEPEPVPEPQQVATPPLPQPVPEPQAKLPDPDIALEKEKKRKQELEKKLAEEKQKEKEKKRLAEEQEKKKLAEIEKKKQLEDQKRKQEEAAEVQRDKARRDNNLKRLQAMAGEGTPTSTGDAERSSGPKTDANYLGKIAGRIKSNTRFATTDAIPGNPTVEYELELLPDGSVKEIKITRVSGYAAYDEAVKRAIYLSAPFPPDPSSGRVPSSIAARQRLKEN